MKEKFNFDNKAYIPGLHSWSPFQLHTHLLIHHVTKQREDPKDWEGVPSPGGSQRSISGQEGTH